MNKTLIAAAVSAALMAPVAAQADVTLYGRIHQGIKIVNPEMGDSTSDFIGVGSRFGIKASSDLGNGLTASAQYEFGTTSDRNNHGSNAVTEAADDSLWSADSSGITNRIATVGISGAFGSIDLGNQWGAYYNIAGVHMDPTFHIGSSIYYGIVDTNTYRTANTIKYSNSFGPVSLQLDVRLDDTDKKGGDVDPAAIYTAVPDGLGDQGGNGYAFGASVALTDNITIAAATDDNEGRTQTGAAIQVSLGNYWASIASQKKDNDDSNVDPSSTHLWLGGSFGNTSAMVGAGSGDKGGASGPGNDPSEVILGVYHDMGGGLKLLYEGVNYDSDNNAGDFSAHLFGIRLDF